MGWSFRKSIKVAPGVRLNLSRSGIGMSAGVKGARIGVGPRGAYVRGGVGGVYYQQRLGGSRHRGRGRTAVQVAPPATLLPSTVAELDALLEQAPPKSPWVAALVGLFPGGGQMYLGQWGWGIVVLLTSWLIAPWLAGWLLGVRRAAHYAAGRRVVEQRRTELAGTV